MESDTEAAERTLMRSEIRTLRERLHVLERRVHDIEMGIHIGALRADVHAGEIAEIRELIEMLTNRVEKLLEDANFDVRQA